MQVLPGTVAPLLVDIDTGFGGALSIERTIKDMEAAGVAAVHLEDQVSSFKNSKIGLCSLVLHMGFSTFAYISHDDRTHVFQYRNSR